MKIRFSADSNGDFCPALIERYNVAVQALPIELDGKYYMDGVDLTPDDIITAVNRGAALPKTSAANVGDYQEHFAKLLKDCDAVMHFNLGSGFSCGVQNARLAAEGLPVYIIDSLNISTGVSILLPIAAELLDSGMEPAEVVAKMEEIRDKTDCSFILDRLDYLYKGGRCSMLAMLGANVLHLRPCIEVKDSKMVVGKKYRGTYERCVRQFINDKLKDADTIDHSRVILTHTGLTEDVLDNICKLIKEKIDFEEVLIARAGCSITCHCGENTFGIIMMRK